MKNVKSKQTQNSAWYQLYGQLNGQFWGQLSGQLGYQLVEQIRGQLGWQLWRQLEEQLREFKPTEEQKNKAWEMLNKV